MFELLARIQFRALLLMIYLSNYERNLLCKFHAYNLKDLRDDAMDVEDKDEIS